MWQYLKYLQTQEYRLEHNFKLAAITKVRSNHKHAESNSKKVVKCDHYKDTRKDILTEQVSKQITEEKILDKYKDNI